MDGVGSFGAGRAGAEFDPISFIQQPQTILRILAWIFSMVVFGSIINEGYVNIGSETLHCVFNKNNDACNYGITIGLIAFLASIFFLVLDIKFQQISSVKDRKKAVLLEIGFSGLWTFLWFVGFCFLANQWQRTTSDNLPLNQGADAARAAIAFSFFSIFTWAGLTVRAVQKYLLGTDMSLFTTEHLDGLNLSSHTPPVYPAQIPSMRTRARHLLRNPTPTPRLTRCQFTSSDDQDPPAV
ncbi:Synaptogyrin-3 [Bagarius yarrelli]|uniref:Synaptogyrin n=1 Tax=Bagarius yarrelli TaxID=175774 RepID=A0A556TP84_BAGYA|nr:Synaptogyrin-3 [Bagarius yarrelli]